VSCCAEKRAAKALEADQVQLKEQLTVMRSQRMAEVSNMHQHAKTMVVSVCCSVVVGVVGWMTHSKLALSHVLAPGLAILQAQPGCP
jgi:hypothetical protein